MKRTYLILILFIMVFMTSCKKKDDKKENNVVDKVSITIDDGNNIVTNKYDKGTTYKFEEIKKDHFDFLYWKDIDGNIVTDVSFDKDNSYKAYFEEHNYNVRFLDGEDVLDSKTYHYGDDIVFIDEPTKINYTFLGFIYNGMVVSSLTCKGDMDITTMYKENPDLIAEAMNYITLPEETDVDLEFPSSYKDVVITWKSSIPTSLSNSGVVTRSETNTKVTMTATFKYNNQFKTKKYYVTVLHMDDEDIVKKALDGYTFNNEFVNGSLNLKKDFSTTRTTITTTWTSSNADILSNDGIIISRPEVDTEITLTLRLTLREYSISFDYKVIVKALNFEDLAVEALELENISLMVTTKKHYLPTLFEYGITGSWVSSDKSVMTDDGEVLLYNKERSVKFNLTLELNGAKYMKEYEFNINVKTALPVIKATDFNPENMTNVKVENGRLILCECCTEGTYESDEISTIDFTRMVPSWSAITSKTATVEFLIQAKVNGTWTKYISYCPGGWGLGLNNRSVDTSDSLAKLDTDEFIILNSKSANAIRFKLILRRTTLEGDSPKVSMVAAALTGSTFKGDTYTTEGLKPMVKWDVPRLYQQVVPTIGNSICSATTTTMLLKYKGMDFSSNDSLYEHRYIAGIVKDYGNNIYGNWVYNVVTMGGYGFNAYVERMYSLYELAHQLNYGPVGLSVKGTMTSDKKTYTTGGHLIVLIGYTYENGVLKFISNDPNVSEVECTYSYDVINTTWRNIAYIIE